MNYKVPALESQPMEHQLLDFDIALFHLISYEHGDSSSLRPGII
jgi:hypothetical protein